MKVYGYTSDSAAANLARKKPKYRSNLVFRVHNVGTGSMAIRDADKRTLLRLPAGERALCRWSGPGWAVHRLRMVPKTVRRVRTRIRGSQ